MTDDQWSQLKPFVERLLRAREAWEQAQPHNNLIEAEEDYFGVLVQAERLALEFDQAQVAYDKQKLAVFGSELR